MFRFLPGRWLSCRYVIPSFSVHGGLILPVGGIKEKVLAAKRAGIACVLLPELNRKDMEEITALACAGIRFEFLKTVDAALLLALEPESPNEFLPSKRFMS